jgi:predicted transcriptional regulator
MNSIEYKLKGNEFKFLQFLKTVDEPISYRRLAQNLNMSDRAIRNLVRVLHGLYVIEKENKTGTNEYTINEYEKWIIQ